jgi:hypothetical protein
VDLLGLLEDRVERLAPGDYSLGLRAVAQHIVAAEAHLTRGQAGDRTAFSDAIYRTNQAFEGALKEGYRVLAGRDPGVVRPFEIESYFEEAKLLRPRVLSQVSSYRKDWRNPSTHDYRLEFDENEALLAIVTVTAMAVMLVDQISGKLNFESAQARAAAVVRPSSSAASLLEQVSDALLTFRWTPPAGAKTAIPRDEDLVSAIAGHLTATIPYSDVTMYVSFGLQRQEIDMVVRTLGGARLIVEVRRETGTMESFKHSTIESQMSHSMEIARVADAVLYIHRLGATGKMKREEVATEQGRIVVVSPDELDIRGNPPA